MKNSLAAYSCVQLHSTWGLSEHLGSVEICAVLLTILSCFAKPACFITAQSKRARYLFLQDILQYFISPFTFIMIVYRYSNQVGKGFVCSSYAYVFEFPL